MRVRAAGTRQPIRSLTAQCLTALGLTTLCLTTLCLTALGLTTLCLTALVLTALGLAARCDDRMGP
ncbi:hypothetical protein ETD86_34595 [Nonomuraea turkmeniaca]|uniref:Uncharacterized protein n=1 Tax=Nonomuraea turkmeniaca TaxID=103838 RepID=A0A5S4F6X2_9ACTN|nr:hypothetical protein [Nonomuraea turkmeniaca]TMR11806.1 hypothetical protein ETD86_34595 [Nonomuraea turkmeniaca]